MLTDSPRVAPDLAHATLEFEFEPKSERINMRLPKSLLTAVKTTASHEGIPYQRFIRQALEQAVNAPKKTPRPR